MDLISTNEDIFAKLQSDTYNIIPIETWENNKATLFFKGRYPAKNTPNPINEAKNKKGKKSFNCSDAG